MTPQDALRDLINAHAYPGANWKGRALAQLDAILTERERLGGILHDLAQILGVKPIFGAVEEEVILVAARRLAAKAGEDARLGIVLELMREAHHCALMGSGPKTKANLGEATRMLAALIDGRE